MVTERPVEFLIEKHAVLPKARLVAERVGHRDCAIDEAAAAHQLAALAIGKEHEGTGADASGLLVHPPVGLAAD